jgi:hypothetical protein
MPFDWQNSPSTSTPVSAENLEASAAQTVTEAISARQTSGRYYYSQNIPQSASALTINQLMATPLLIGRSLSLDRIAVNVGSGGTAGSVVRLGIYSDDGNGLPGSLLVDAGTVVTTGTGVQEATINQAVSPGWIWLAGAAQVAVPQIARTAGIYYPMGYTTATVTNSALASAYIHNGTVSGTLPGTFLPTTNNAGFVISVRVA